MDLRCEEEARGAAGRGRRALPEVHCQAPPRAAPAVPFDLRDASCLEGVTLASFSPLLAAAPSPLLFIPALRRPRVQKGPPRNRQPPSASLQPVTAQPAFLPLRTTSPEVHRGASVDDGPGTRMPVTATAPKAPGKTTTPKKQSASRAAKPLRSLSSFPAWDRKWLWEASNGGGC